MAKKLDPQTILPRLLLEARDVITKCAPDSPERNRLLRRIDRALVERAPSERMPSEREPAP